MSATEVSSDAEDSDAPVVPKAKRRFNKRIAIIAGGAVMLALIAAMAAFYMFRPAGEADGASAEAHGEKASEAHDGEAVTYVDAPAMIINLRAPDGVPRFLKIRFTFVPETAAKGEELKNRLPLIIDAFQPFLRELRPEDLAGSAAVFRIKEELLVRATGAVGAGTVKDILIQDLIQQ